MQSTREQGLLARFLNTILPAPSPDRLVRVAEVDRTALRLAEGSMADVHLSPVIREISGYSGDSRYMILVPARDADIASAVLAGV